MGPLTIPYPLGLKVRFLDISTAGDIPTAESYSVDYLSS